MPELPDDLMSWPSDPYAILGVAPGTPARAIRQAYTALIRRFKPETYPEQFRRIREAYDQVQSLEKWRSFAPPPTTGPQTIKPPSENPPPADSQVDDTVPMDLPPWTATSPEIVDNSSLWDEACTGGHDRVYRALLDIVHRGNAPESVYLRLYWLRVAFPDVDWEVKPIDWLVKALSAGHEQGRVAELVQIELLHRRELCRDLGLFHASTRIRQHDVASRIYLARWNAAIKHDQWTLVVDEIPRARTQFLDAPHAAVNLFAWLVGVLAWNLEDHVQRAYRESKRELESIAAGNRDFDYALERIDFLIELIEQWRRIPQTGAFHRAIRELLPVSWSGTAGEIRWHVFALYERIFADTSDALSLLDQLARSVPLVLSQVVASAQQTYFPSRGGFRLQPEQIKTIYRNWPGRNFQNGLQRFEIADFLAREQLTVDDLVYNVPYDEMHERAKAAIAQLSADNPLRLVNLAQLTLSQ